MADKILMMRLITFRVEALKMGRVIDDNEK
jgi:hypothetical protein